MTNTEHSYAGDVTPEEAWQRLSDQQDAVIIDVRTQAEWQFVGLPDLSSIDKEPLLIQWLTHEGPNPHFVAELTSALSNNHIVEGASLFFLCRSGARSKKAAIACTQEGYGSCYNIATGFEGDLDDAQHRGTINGWRAAGLPWVQS